MALHFTAELLNTMLEDPGCVTLSFAKRVSVCVHTQSFVLTHGEREAQMRTHAGTVRDLAAAPPRLQPFI